MGFDWSGETGSIAQRRQRTLNGVRKRLAKGLRTRRKELGLSQRTLATILSTNQSLIKRVEQNGVVETALLELWTATLGITFRDFMQEQRETILSYPDWAPNTPHFYGKSAEDWNAFQKEKDRTGVGRFPHPAGLSSYGSAHYKLFGKAAPGEVKRKFLRERAAKVSATTKAVNGNQAT